jgi:hypothetical protein
MLATFEKFFVAPSINILGEYDYMCIDPISRTIVTALLSNNTPIRSNYSASDYEDLKPGSVKLRTLGYSDWTLYRYHVHTDSLWWELRNACYRWEVTPKDAVPEWAHTMFRLGRRKLEKRGWGQ